MIVDHPQETNDTNLTVPLLLGHLPHTYLPRLQNQVSVNLGYLDITPSLARGKDVS